MASVLVKVEVLDEKCKDCPNIDVSIDKIWIYSGGTIIGCLTSGCCSKIEECKRLKELWLKKGE